MATILNRKWPPKYKNPPIWAKFDFQHDRVKNWALIISCYVLTLFFIHTTSTCIVRLGDICSALRYSNQYLFIIVLSHSHWYNSPQVGMSLYSDTLFWFRYNTLLLLLLSAAYIVEKQEIPMLLSLVWLTWTWTQDIPHSKEIH